jgi:rubrerythrin
MPGVSEPIRRHQGLPTPVSQRVGVEPRAVVTPQQMDEDKMSCDRCGAEMYRMHAVWRCPACGFKTDCCGW